MTEPNDAVSPTTPLSRTQASADAPDWRFVLGRLHVAVTAPSFPAAIEFVNVVAALAEQHQHHPEIDIRYTTVLLATSSHDVGAVTSRDTALANAIADEARTRGLELGAAPIADVELAIDCVSADRIRPFWKAVLDYEDDGDDALVDPSRRGFGVWFQVTDGPAAGRNRLHLDVSVPHDQLEGRLRAALEAGGTLVSDDAAPAFWVLADADGNEACLCTWQGRDTYDESHPDL